MADNGCGRPISKAYQSPVRPQTNLQVGGFVIGNQGLQAFRWVVTREDVVHTVDGTLRCQLSAITMSFLKPHIEKTTEPIDVYLFHGATRGYVGLYDVKEWDEKALVLRPQQKTTAVPSSCNIVDAFRTWGLDSVSDVIQFPLDGETIVPVSGMLFDALHSKVVQWCGPLNRIGSTCILQFFDNYPPPEGFRVARKLATHYRFPVLQLFGFGKSNYQLDAAVLDNQGLQCILFKPGHGDNCRVHFNRDDDGKVYVMLGEIGDIL